MIRSLLWAWTLGLSKLEEGRTRRACRYLERAAYLEPDREAAWWRHCSEVGRDPWDREP